MVKQVAGFIVAPMWHSIFEEALRGVANENFKAPKAIDQNTKPFIRGFWKGGENYYIDTISGKLATEYTPKETKKEVVVGGVHSILHWIDRNDPTGPSPKTPEDNSQYILWEPIVQKWALQNGYTNENSITAPTQTDDIHLPEFFPRISVISPSPSASYSNNSRIPVNLSIESKYPISVVEFYLNDLYVGTSQNAPFELSLVPSEFNADIGSNRLRIVAKDSVFNRTELEIQINTSI